MPDYRIFAPIIRHFEIRNRLTSPVLDVAILEVPSLDVAILEVSSLDAAILEASSLDDMFLYLYLGEVLSWMLRPWMLLLWMIKLWMFLMLPLEALFGGYERWMFYFCLHQALDAASLDALMPSLNRTVLSFEVMLGGRK